MGEPLSGHSREGETLCGKYLLQERLGQGGMGQVYRARNVLVGREVAIKVLRKEYAKNPTIVTRFLREAQAANIVRHTNVVDVLDIGTDEGGIPFIVQELLHGQDLASYVRDALGKLSLRETMRFLGPVIEAVASGHERGVVHRDLKPENVFLADIDGKVVPKLLDFGISQIRPKAGEEKVTQLGTMMGTPQYMSPEQVRGKEIDARTDVWSLGVMLYEVLSGRRPFTDPVPALYVAICGMDPVPLRTAAPDVPHAVSDVVDQCMLRDQSLRYPDARALAQALFTAYQTARPSGGASGGRIVAAAAAPPSGASHPAPRHAGSPHPESPPAAPPRAEPSPTDAEDAPLPKVPSLLPPPPVVSAPPPKTAVKTSAPPIVVASSPLDDDDDAHALRGSGLSIDAPVPTSARPRPVSSYTMADDPPPPVPEGESAAPYIAGGLLALGVGIGLVAMLFAYDAFHAEVFVGNLHPDGVRLVPGGLLSALGVFLGVRGYRTGRDEPHERSGPVVAGAIAGVLVFVGLKLLTFG